MSCRPPGQFKRVDDATIQAAAVGKLNGLEPPDLQPTALQLSVFGAPIRLRKYLQINGDPYGDEKDASII
jgi:hypothetical protein